MTGRVPRFAIFTSIAVVFLLIGILYMNEDHFYANLPIGKKVFPAEEITYMTSGTPEQGTSPGNMRIYVAEPEKGNKLSEGTYHNIKKALHYANVRYEVLPPEKTGGIQGDPYTMIILTGEDTSRWNAGQIGKFVKDGGRLFAANRFADPEWYDLLGIKQEKGFDDEVKGIAFSDSFFNGYPNLDSASDYFSNSMLKAELVPEAKTYITAEKIPLLWTRDYGAGRVVNWNGTGLQDKSTRGIIVQAISLAFPAFVSGQAGEKVMFIDDFPAPIAKREAEKIKRDYGMAYDEFYREVWWPDMKAISGKYDFPYTGAMIGTYLDKPHVRSSQLIEMSQKDLLLYGRQLLSAGGELALHGYNHESLVTRSEPVSSEFGYRYWDSQKEMEEALLELRTVQEELFSDQTFKTYVPPSNLLNRSGISAVRHTMPGLEVISSLYTGDPSNGSLIQEFGYDSVYKDLYHFPRINSGYSFTKEDQFQLADAAANMGVFSHFIHPDDVLDEERSKNQSWESLKGEYVKMQKFLHDQFPYLKGYTQYGAKERLAAYQEGKWNVEYSDSGIEIHGYKVPSPSLFLIRIEEGKKLKPAQYHFGKIEERQPGLYLLTMNKPDAKVVWKEAE
ncbi:DUF2194 domain-containing protein [Bacillus sp. FJAT-42376]|uniref:DUF2194 domain-containing protein n=1 Tax=Bacillus sp. FJAT-42376 TaxID=2014076 RepID=UPI000F51130F|nr:DUF2194 domain-containing protein [Bacillus sp. FJAT-42376]AZB43958.1 DUF2194 domain-containing protein [Bacillus sp. FJAT-42376]